MITLNQVLLLQQKVESAVEKIQQLQMENDALRSKCAELTNALSTKSEQLSSFQNDQSQIENGILRALDKLDAIENSVLKAGQVLNNSQNSKPASSTTPTTPSAPFSSIPETKTAEQPTVIINSNNLESYSNYSQLSPLTEEPDQIDEPNFDTMEETESESQDDDNNEELGFDIF